MIDCEWLWAREALHLICKLTFNTAATSLCIDCEPKPMQFYPETSPIIFNGAYASVSEGRIAACASHLSFGFF